MKKVILSLLTITFLSATMMLSAAEGTKAAKKEKDAKAERTIRGTAVCTKCSLKETETCGTAIQVTRKNKSGEEKKTAIYLADNDVAKAFAGKVCKGSQPVTAVGTVKKEGGKTILTASKIAIGSPEAKGKKKAKI